MDEFISLPKQKFIDTPKAEALKNPTRRSKIEIEELLVSKSFPEGQFTMPDNNTLIIWNFDVGRSELKKEHIAQINKFVRGVTTQLTKTVTEFYVIGHASLSGATQENDRLSRERSTAVANILKRLGFSIFMAEGRGNSEPYPFGTDGLALARQRRVEILRISPSFEKQKVIAPEFIIPDSKWNWNEVPQSSNILENVNFAFETPTKSWTLGSWKNGLFTLSAEMVGTFKISVGSSKAKIIFKEAFSHEKGLNVVIEQKLREGVKAKFTFEPGLKEKSAGLKAGIQFERRDLALFKNVEVGLQPNVQFVYVKFDTDEIQFGLIKFNGSKANLSFKGTLKFNIGAGDWLIKQLARFAAPAAAAETTALAPLAAVGPAAAIAITSVGVIVVTSVIIGGTGYAIVMAKDEGLRKARLLAYRDIFASTIAYRISDSPDEFYSRLNEWLLKKELGTIVGDTRTSAEQAIRNLSDEELKKKLIEWKERYGHKKDGTEDSNFTAVRERMFFALGGYNFSDLDISRLELSQL